MGLSKSKKNVLEQARIANEFKHKAALFTKKQNDIIKEYSKALDVFKMSQLRKTFSKLK